MSPSSAARLPQAHIRDATEADLPRIVELLAQLSLDDPREDTSSPLPESYRRAFQLIDASEHQRLLVIEVDGRVVGSTLFVLVPNISHMGRPYAMVEDVVVDAAERGSGYGEQLMRFAVEEARQADCYKLSLTSNKRRSDAHRFYERLGFTASHEGFRIDL